MKLLPSENLSESQVQSGLKLVVKDGLTAEAMSTLTGGAFLVAMALHMGASNIQIGLLAALPTIANIFQLVAIWLVQRYNNRRAISVICSFFARFPLLIIGVLPFLFTAGTSLKVLIFLLFFHYFFGAIVGASWNSWMKDLVPEKMLGTYFSQRTRLIQIMNVTLSLMVALSLDYVKSHYPQYEIMAYSVMFLIGGALGMLGVYLLAKTPEPKSHLENGNILKLIGKPLKDKNFRRLLVFNSFWAFSLNLATPFFSVYLMKTINLPLSYIIGLGIIGQISSILFIKVWGRYSDKFSNKTIISICAPLYIGCILAWTFTAMPTVHALTMPLLIIIHIVSGVATAGINLAISNIGIKLAPKDEAIVYIAARNMITAMIPAIAPILGGFMADFFASRQLAWSFQWQSPNGSSMINILELRHWDFFFVIGAVLAFCSLRLLRQVKEQGEVNKDVVVTEMLTTFKIRLKHQTSKRSIRAKVYRLAMLPALNKDDGKKRA
jgi:MFS family permease